MLPLRNSTGPQKFGVNTCSKQAWHICSRVVLFCPSGSIHGMSRLSHVGREVQSAVDPLVASAANRRVCYQNMNNIFCIHYPHLNQTVLRQLLKSDEELGGISLLIEQNLSHFGYCLKILSTGIVLFLRAFYTNECALRSMAIYMDQL
jgi:hypothetical protein